MDGRVCSMCPLFNQLPDGEKSVNKAILSVAVAAAFAASPAVVSAQLSLTSLTPIWSNACNVSGACGTTSFSNIGLNNTDPNDVRVLWPGTFGSSASQYGFVRSSTPLPINVVGPTKVNLGLFSHYNNPINVSTQYAVLDYADMQMSFGFAGGAPSSFDQTFRFNHLETFNNGTCQYGSNPCADLVTFIDNETTSSFTVNGTAYTLRLAGFSQDGGTTFVNEFWSTEGSSNSAGLYAEISRVPEPSSLILTAAGLSMLVMIGNRRRNTRQA